MRKAIRCREVRVGNEGSVKEHVYGENNEDESQDLLGEGGVPVVEDREHGLDEPKDLLFRTP